MQNDLCLCVFCRRPFCGFFSFVHEAKSVHISPRAPLVYALWIIAMKMQRNHQLVVVEQGELLSRETREINRRDKEVQERKVKCRRDLERTF